VVDDVDRSASDDVERGVALAVLEDDVTARERELGADLRQVLDLLRCEAWKERRMVGVEEVLYRSGCVVASSDNWVFHGRRTS
jgi:hypothetical protein